MYNDVLINSKALGGSKLAGTINRVSSPLGAILFSHNAAGNKDVPLIATLEQYYFQKNYNTLRYNFHYVNRIAVENAKFEDIISDIDGAYTFLLENSIVRNVYLIGASLGGVACLEYSLQAQIRCPVVVLGFFEPLVTKYVTEARLKDLKSPILVLHGEKDQYLDVESVRTYLGRNRLNFTLYGVPRADHRFDPVNEAERGKGDIISEIELKITDFIAKTTS